MLVLLAALQGGLKVNASADRTHIAVGQTVAVTVRVQTEANSPVTFQLPLLAGFAIVRTQDVTDVSLQSSGRSMRSLTHRIVLRAQRPGPLTVGAIRVRQGKAQVVTRSLVIVVDRATGPVAGLTLRARDLVDRAIPPQHNDDVAVAAIVTSDTALVGEQVDVLIAAWFPRELRLRLRAQPRITLPVPVGGWSYPDERPEQPVASHQVGGRWMDLYVVHGTLFPLEPGRFVIPPAAVEYGLPVSFSIFSREERFALHTDSVAVIVLPPPRQGRPEADDILVGSGFMLALASDPLEGRVGEPLKISATLSGVGNAALWPAPIVHWPTGFRAYPTETSVSLEPKDGLIAGTKTFSYLVVPDSAGSFVVPELRYAYYDLDGRHYSMARTAPQSLTVLAGSEPRAARPLPPLLETHGETWVDAMNRWLGTVGWGLVFVGPPLVVFVVAGFRRRRAPESPEAQATRTLTRLGTLERDFQTLLASHVPDLATRDGDRLARALRAAGIESAAADHVMRLRDRLRAVRYGPRGAGDATDLAAELEHVLRVLGAEPSRRRRRRLVATLVVAMLAAGHSAAAQTASAEDLYQAGALRAAADSFAARAASDPGNAANWYNLGATLYRAGEDGKAVAAWTVAARRAPRNSTIERARRSVPAPDIASDDLLSVGLATPLEWVTLAALCWLAFWVAVLVGARRGVRLGLGAIALVLAGCGALEARQRTRPLAVVIGAGTPVRSAPYGSASAGTSLDAGAAVLLKRRYGRWVEVTRGDGIHGWMLGSEVVPL